MEDEVFRIGDLISVGSPKDPDVYFINAYGYERLIISPVVMDFYKELGFERVRTVSQGILDAFIFSPYARNCVAKDNEVYALIPTQEDGGVKGHIHLSAGEVLEQDPHFFERVFCVGSEELETFGPHEHIFSLDEIPRYRR